MRARPTRPLSRSTVLLGIGLLAHIVVGAICALDPVGHLGDFNRYWELATHPGCPYRDYPSEYPPGALGIFKSIRLATADPQVFNGVLLTLNVLADLAIVGLLAWTWGSEAATFYTLAGIPILSLLYFRMDLWSTAAATAALAFWVRQQPRSALAALWAGAALKVWPIMLGAVFVAPRKTRRLAPITGLVVMGVASAGLWVSVSGVQAVLQVLTFRGASGWDIESTVGSLWHLVSAAPTRLEAGAVRIGWNHPAISAALFVFCTPVALWAVRTGAMTGRLGLGWLAGIGAILSCSALLSPQFLGWLLPGAAIAWVEDDRDSASMIGVVVALTVTYRILHTQTEPGLVLMRNLMLVFITARALAALRAQLRDDRVAPGSRPISRQILT